MNDIQLNEYFLNQLENGMFKIKVGKGNASYKMNRGSFKTRDIKKDIRTLVFSHKENDKYYFKSNDIVCEVTVIIKDKIRFHFEMISGEYNRFYVSFNTFEDETIYGCGEQYSTLNLKGKTVPIWVSEHQQTMHIASKLLSMKIVGKRPGWISPYRMHQTYASFPVFMSSKNYGFYVHDESYGKISFKKSKVIFEYRSIPKSITLLTANSQKEIMQKIANIVGISTPLPSWVGDGAILGIQGGTDVVREKYHKAKENGVKIAGVWCQDWCGNVVTSFGYQVYWNWTLDNNLYHDFDSFLEELKRDGVKFLGYINTFLKENAPLYNEAKEKSYLVKKVDGSVYHIKSTTFDAGIVDLTNPDAYKWYKSVIKNNIIGIGISGFMADFGEYLPTDSVVYGGDATTLHNSWPTLWAKCCHDAIEASGKSDEIFMFSRAAYSHTVSYTNSIWNGDQHVDFSDEHGLGSVIPASLSLACSGTGVVHSDIGGYTTVMWMKRTKDVLLRWSEMNIFTPIFRTHEGNRPSDNVQFDNDEVISEFAENSNIFYELKPYRKHVEDEYQNDHIAMIRPLFAHYDDEQSKLEKREFLFGEDILVSPVMRENENKHKVFLPKGNWVQFFTGKEFEQGEHYIPSPMGLSIAFYKKDSQFKELFETISQKHKKEI